MSDTVVVAIIEALPRLFWAIVALVALLHLLPLARERLLPRMTHLRAAGIEVQFAIETAMGNAVQVARKHKNWDVKVDPAAAHRAAMRAERAREILAGARLLWVDDVPDFYRNERRMFEKLDVVIDAAVTTEQALGVLTAGAEAYDVVVTDMARTEQGVANPRAGLDLLAALAEAGRPEPVIVYLGDFDPKLGTPVGAFGITNRPDELLHLVLDVLERGSRSAGRARSLATTG